MTATWRSDDAPAPVAIGPLGWALVACRGLALLVLVFGGLAILLALRAAERPLCGMRRPVTPFITQFVCRSALRILGIGFTVEGAPLHDAGATVANHGSWLDIFVLNAADRVYFVSKSEVRDWPGIGWLARATGTLFIRRDRREAKEQTKIFAERLEAGQQLLFFPEGTSTDGQRVLPFKTTLFEAFLSPALAPLKIQPVSVRYFAPEGADPRFYGWWGDMDFGSHMLKVMATPRQGRVRLRFHDPLIATEFVGRKVLAAAAETAVRDGFER